MKNTILLYIIIVILSVSTLALGGYIIYDKALDNQNGVSEAEQNKSNIPNYDNYELASRYNNIANKGSYIIFKENGTWEATQNYCEGYDNISGTYTIINNQIILESDVFPDNQNVFTIEYGNPTESDIVLLYDKDSNVSGCSLERYYVMQK